MRKTSSKYRQYDAEKMILRDHLAYDRTIFALERTLLSYARTVFLLLTTGLTFIKLLGNNTFFLVLGIILLPLAAVVFAFGLIRFFKFQAELRNIYKKEKLK